MKAHLDACIAYREFVRESGEQVGVRAGENVHVFARWVPYMAMLCGNGQL